MSIKERESICPTSIMEWRKWLEENHATAVSIWLIQYKKAATMPSLTWSQVVDEALCFGWIDSTRKTVDNERYKQFFCRRKPNSTWSKVNKEKVTRLIACGKMTQAGLKPIEVAKQNGSWTLLDEVEELIVPADLQLAFDANLGSKAFYLSLSKSVKKQLLHWVVMAKRDETRQNRISEIATNAAQQQKPKPFR